MIARVENGTDSQDGLIARRVQRQYDEACERLERLERQMAEAKAQKVLLEGLLGPAPGRVSGKFTGKLVDRRKAAHEVIGAHGPMRPAELLAALRHRPRLEGLTRANVTDLLRRSLDLFQPLGDGRWGLLEAAPTNGNGKHGNGTAGGKAEDEFGAEGDDIPF